MVKITTFHNRPVRHVRYMPDGESFRIRAARRRQPLPDPLTLGGTGYLRVNSIETQRCTFRPPRGALLKRRSDRGFLHRDDLEGQDAIP